ncbi:MAG: hypothetical protein M1829_005709 [Trizodia sp. TS-e1964]|nr:MAG: hypothetical protein M1829_005709 [Trizodia sp. TS-e1964]
MADPFEVRMRFTSQLQHLNASTTSAQKAAHYALKYRDMDEDLHSCILEQIEKNSMNNRANIMYFIEHLCELAQKENHVEFVRMVQRDILRLVDAVAPVDGSGAANVKVARRVLQGLQAKGILIAQTIEEIEIILQTRDILPKGSDSSALAPTLDTSATAHDPLATPRSANANGVTRPDKREIEQRIEEDRERHKRLRENIWAVPADSAAEFQKILADEGEVTEEDLIASADEAAERNMRCYF